MTATLPSQVSAASREDRFIALLVTFLLAVQLVNLATFNLQPDRLRAVIDGLSFIGYGLLFILTLRYGGVATAVHWIGLALFVGAALIAFGRNPERAQIGTMVKDMSGPMVLGILTMRHAPAPDSRTLRLLWWVAVAAGLLGATLALTGEPYINVDDVRLSVFAGGSDGLHPSAYASLIFLLTLLVLFWARIGVAWISLLAPAVVTAAIIGYEVRTVWTMMAILGGLFLFHQLSRGSAWLAAGAVGAALILTAFFILTLIESGFDFTHFSSGRTVIYFERLEMIGNRSLLDFLFGSGAGTDLMRGVAAWRWEDKDSHSDLMSILVEGGLIGLLGFAMMVLAALWALPPAYKGWVLMMAVSAVISNGVLLRPSIGPPLILTAYLAVALRHRYGRAVAETAPSSARRRGLTTAGA